MRLIDVDALLDELPVHPDGGMRSVKEASLMIRVRETVRNAPTVSGWVSVKDRVPEENVAVNIVWVNTDPEIYYEHIKGKPFTATGVYFRGEWYWWSSVVQDYLSEYGVGFTDKMDKVIVVTHWMPLPEPPEVKKEASV